MTGRFVYVPFETRGYLPLLGFRGKNQTNLNSVRFAHGRRPLGHEQMTSERKIGMKGSAEETGMAPALI
jgi:hypothetical protein